MPANVLRQVCMFGRENKCYIIKEMSRYTAQSGQIGLVVLLVMVVVSTIGLSVASRTTQEVTVSRQVQEASRSFAAAESAIERILSEESGRFFDFEGDVAQYSSQDETLQVQSDAEIEVEVEKQFELEGQVEEGTAIEILVDGAQTDNQLSLEWSDTRNCDDNPASLVISITNETAGTTNTRYLAVAPCDHSDNFEVFDPNALEHQGEDKALRYVITLNDGDQIVRVTPVYADTSILAAGIGDWLSVPQQYRILSVGKNITEGGQETKAVEVERSQPITPYIFDYALISGSTIIKGTGE